MLTIFPCSDENHKNQVLGKYKIKGTEQSLLIAKEGEKELGYIAFDLSGYKLYILDISINEDNDSATAIPLNELIDSMIRAASSFALNRKIFILCSENECIFSILESFGFERYKDIMQVDLSKIIGKCHHLRPPAAGG